LLLGCLFVVACGDGEARRERVGSAAGATDTGGITSTASSSGGNAGVANGGVTSGETGGNGGVTSGETGGNGGVAGTAGGTSSVTAVGGASNAAGGVGGSGGTSGAVTSGATGGTPSSGGTNSATGGTSGNGGASGTGGSAGDLVERLERIEGLRVVSHERLSSGEIRVNLTIEQPNDHEQPEGPKFEQTIQLLHRSADAPMVLISTGYDIEMGFGGYELVPALGANLLGIEHRFFGTSKPEPLDWSLLNIKQAAADTHHIVESLRGLYTRPWLSTGASKGGMASVYHRRFYPDDVVGTVAYVAPLSFGAPDNRYLDFLANVGGPELSSCRERLASIQVEALERRAALIPQIAALEGITDADAESALESTVWNLPFSFWQSLGVNRCGWLPAADATDVRLFEFLFLDLSGYSDPESQRRFLPYYYQAYTEFGYPAIRSDHFAHLLKTKQWSLADALPGVPVEFHPEVMQDISSWVKSAGNRLMFVYGEYDPWTAGAFELGKATDSYVFVQPKGTHSALITRLALSDAVAAYAIVKRWAGVSDASPASALAAPPSILFSEPELRVLPPVPPLFGAP
jgi:hypothetical protein